MWATSDPEATFQFASEESAQAKQARRIKALAGFSAFLLPVTIGLQLVLPPSPAAALLIGLLYGFGASIPIGILLALWTEQRRCTQPLTTVVAASFPAYVDGQICLFHDDDQLEFLDGEELFLYGLPAPLDQAVTR